MRYRWLRFFCRKFEEIFADSKYRCIFAVPIGKPNAEIAQLVERNLAKVEVAGPSPVFRSKITTATMVVVFRIRQSLPRPLCFPTIPVSPTLHPYFPHLTHQEQKRPSTQYFFLICNIGKPAPCPTLPSVAHPCFPHLTHREQKCPSTQYFFLICNIGKPAPCPTLLSVAHPCFPHLSTYV